MPQTGVVSPDPLTVSWGYHTGRGWGGKLQKQHRAKHESSWKVLFSSISAAHCGGKTALTLPWDSPGLTSEWCFLFSHYQQPLRITVNTGLCPFCTHLPCATMAQFQ